MGGAKIIKKIYLDIRSKGVSAKTIYLVKKMFFCEGLSSLDWVRYLSDEFIHGIDIYYTSLHLQNRGAAHWP